MRGRRRSLHAEVGVPARDRAQLERLYRYVARPAIASERLALLADGRNRDNFKRTWRDGSVAVECDPIDVVGKPRRWFRDHARTWYAITDAWAPTRACAPTW